ncbi:MAG: bifunctional phosphopantothenoylcysteine decarboxylase/phosphopantothenate--cysteine ligase CoaBC [Defluviitaleaceae bacterium]|nr:bifunctional phosphopantothenoylcysteine decarboxylase/phosphopantothenate--cysteine ligase CoaBC [Defluviitaleaceae bacterium]
MDDKKTVVLGVTGSIAAYKAADIISHLTKKGCDVNVIMTKAAAKFITPLTFQTLTKNKVYVDMFEEIAYGDVRHISLAQRADCFVIAPATANIIGKIASGIADDMLSTVVMAVQNKPVIICPAMNTAMYENAVTQRNINKLREYGYQFVEPKESLLACGDVGKGALADISDIIASIKTALSIH